MPELLLRALGYIVCVTLAKTLLSVVQSGAALAWRGELTAAIHAAYVRGAAHYHLGLLRPSLDNPDQRIARELELWYTTARHAARIPQHAPRIYMPTHAHARTHARRSACLADVFVSVSTSLFNVVWYTTQTWLIMGWQGPALIFVFFGASAGVTRLLASPVAALTARVQAAEGDFRAVHTALLQVIMPLPSGASAPPCRC